ncbi:MAG: GatB/YqeY domain-containing protein [Propionicimonas sp.]|nr:GatB/YqeY domain-containing protein [Propionicimonas sp.]
MAELKDRLRADRVVAMKARDELAKNTLGMALTAIQLEEVAGEAARELSDDEVLRVLTREAAKRKDSAEAYAAGNRPELAEKELAEAALLQAYLPAALSEAELDALVAEEVAAAAASLGEKPTMKQMGQVIKAVNARAQGRAEGATIAAKVRSALA